MRFETHKILYPEGDTREIPHSLRFNQAVDLNGAPLRLPIADPRIVAYRVFKISREETRNEEVKLYHLERMNIFDLRDLM